MTMSFIQAQHKKIRLIQWGAIAYLMAVVVLDRYTRNLGKANFYTALVVFACSIIFLLELGRLKIPRYRFKTRNSTMIWENAYSFLRKWFFELAYVVGVADRGMREYEHLLLRQEMNCVHKKLQKVISAIYLILSFMSGWYGVKCFVIMNK